jgi:hypothetical protein
MKITIETIYKPAYDTNFTRFEATVENGDGRSIDLKQPFNLDEFKAAADLFIRNAKELIK